jgi:hypothetical protein
MVIDAGNPRNRFVLRLDGGGDRDSECKRSIGCSFRAALLHIVKTDAALGGAIRHSRAALGTGHQANVLSVESRVLRIANCVRRAETQYAIRNKG